MLRALPLPQPTQSSGGGGGEAELAEPGSCEWGEQNLVRVLVDPL